MNVKKVQHLEGVAAEGKGNIRAGRPGDRIPEGARFFRNRPDRPWRPIQPPIQWVAGLFLGDKAAGAWCYPLTPI